MAVMLSACGKEASEVIQEKVFGIDYSEELAIQRPEQVICGQENAWVITTVKDDYIYKLPYSTGVAGLERIEWNMEGDYYLVNIVEQSGTLYSQIYNKEENTIEIHKWGVNGVWSEVMSIKAENIESYAVVGSGFFVDDSGNVYLVSGDTVTRFDNEGNQIYACELSGNICFFQENGEGDVECVTADTNKITLNKLIEGGAEEKWTLKTSAEKVSSILSSEEGTLCLATNEEILFLDRESGNMLSSTNLVKLGVTSVMAGYYDRMEETLQLYGSVRSGIYDYLDYNLLRERDAFTEQRTELVYGMVGEVNHDATSSIWTAITTFNQENEKYFITIKNYDGWSNLDWLHADMAAGDGPDIIDMIYSHYYQSYVNNGYLEDLTPYLEQSQYKDDIIWNVLDSYRIDGGLYLLVPKFRLEGLLIHPEYESFAEEWNLETFHKLVEKNHWEKDIFGHMGNPESLLYYMLCGRQDEFINWEEKVASFETEEFMDMLEFCREYAATDWLDVAEWTSEERDWNTLCKPVMFGPEFYTYLNYTHTYGREYQIYGYPTLSGQTYGITPCGDSCAIYAGSKQKEGAWEFIESLLWESNQKCLGMVNPGFPIRSSILKEKAVEALDVPIRINNKDVEPVTGRETLILEDVIYNGELNSILIDPIIQSVIEEETVLYFNGDKSAQETAHIIQNRVQLMLGE